MPFHGLMRPYTEPVTASAHDYEDMHQLVDRLSPAQVRRLRVLVAIDPGLQAALGDEPVPRSGTTDPDRRWLALSGIWDAGRMDVAERHDELIRERFSHSA